MDTVKHGSSENLEPMLQQIPKWLPDAMRAYLAHTECGISMRAVARAFGSNPSTVSRQVRRIEIRREDPLVDMAFENISAHFAGGEIGMTHHSRNFWPEDETTLLTSEMARILTQMSYAGTVLAVARHMENAVIVRDGPEGSTDKLAVVNQDVAMAMAMQDWIVSDDPENRIVRYRIAPAGRIVLRDFCPEEHKLENLDSNHKRPKYGGGDTPLMQLSRRRDATGDPFLSSDLIRAGERIREDYELALMDENAPQDWSIYFLSCSKITVKAHGSPSEKAHMRVASALHALGPGLADVVLCCCCRLEGLEKAEKSLNWAARSGKIVLRIALMHLVQHYKLHKTDMMIG